MTFPRALSPEAEYKLLTDYGYGATVPELVNSYSVSQSTVIRLLAYHEVPRRDKPKIPRKKSNNVKVKKLQPCGTNAAYQRHKRNGEYPCVACLEAHVVEVDKYRIPKPRVLKPCGTDAAYQRHIRRKEKACDPCREAHNARKRK